MDIKYIKQINNKIILKVHVIPNSRQTRIVKANDIIEVELKAPPRKGEANRELIKFLSKKLGVSQSDILIVKGMRNKFKILEIHGLALEKATRVLNKYLEGE